MGGLGKGYLSAVALQIEVELRGVGAVAIDHRTSRAVAAAIGVLWCLREEANVVALPDHDNSDLDIELQNLARA